MNGMEEVVLAPLIRGLCIGRSHARRVVIPGPALPEVELPSPALTVDLSSIWSDEAPDEGAVAKALREAYSAWEFERAPAGVEAVNQKKGLRKQPSCIGIRLHDVIRMVYWIDENLDAAQKRCTAGDMSLLEEAVPRQAAVVETADTSARNRAAVVRDKIALVTGGAQGFGEEIVRGLASSGALVFIADLNAEGAETLAKGINSIEKRTAAVAVGVDVSREESVEALFDTIAKTAGGLDLCVSNAGVLRAGGVLDQDLASFKFVTDINYTGFFIIAKHAGRILRRQHLTAPEWKTDIIQINSKSGLEGSNKNGAYAGGKFGGIGLTQSFALELVDYNIKVNAICPGNFLDGPLWSDPEKGLFVQYLRAGKVPGARNIAEVRAFYEAKVPMRRGCTGADVMRAIYYIVEQEYETGQAIPVTGGQIMLH